MFSKALLDLHTSQVFKKLRIHDLAHMWFSTGLVLFYYHVIQQVPQSERLQSNQFSYGLFMIWYYLHTLTPFDPKFQMKNQMEN
jgi:hypothetical protein